MAYNDSIYRERLRNDGEKQADLDARRAWLDAHDAPIPPENPDRVQAGMTETVRNEYAIAVNGCNRPYFSDALRIAKKLRLAEIWKEWTDAPSHTWQEFNFTINEIKNV